jgi:hypothetical protein
VVAKDKISSCAWNWLHILTDGQILERPLISAAILSWFFLQLVSGFVLIVASNVCYMSFDFFHIFYCFWFLHLLARNHKHNALDQRQPTMTMMGTSSCQTETWLASFLYQKTHYILSHAICVLQNNSWFYWTGALTKGCTCMHIIILILSEIDIYFAYIYIYKFHSYPPLCSALFIWVNYTWPKKKKKKKKKLENKQKFLKKKLAKFTKLLKLKNWK